MIEFVKSQWYQSNVTNCFFQCVNDYDDNIGLRIAGQKWLISATIVDAIKDNLTPASIMPNFNKAELGDDYFDATQGMQKISSQTFTAIGNNGKRWHNDPHPLAFNSFAQFQAYWAEWKLQQAKQGENNEV